MRCGGRPWLLILFLDEATEPEPLVLAEATEPEPKVESVPAHESSLDPKWTGAEKSGAKRYDSMRQIGRAHV